MRRKYRVSARLCLAPRISSPPPPFLRRFPPLLLRGTMRNSMPWNDHDDSPFLQIHFRFVIAIEFFTSAQFFWVYRGNVFVFADRRTLHLLPPILSRFVFTRHLVFLIFPYSWREAPFRRYSGETNRITSPLNVLRDHCWDSLLATDEIETSSSRGTDSFETCILVLLSIYEGKFFWNDKCIERKDGSVSIPIMKITWRVYGRSVAREIERFARKHLDGRTGKESI